MKLGLHIGYSGAELRVPVALVQRAEALGYDSVWTAEAYGSDAVTPLAYLAGKTERIKLGTAVMQIAARTPANAAKCAATIEALAGRGRFVAGLGVSGPQIVEGWYGQPWGSPCWRTRDYVAIMRKIFRREAPVSHQGREISLPYDGPGALGIGKPLKSILHMNPDIPIYLGTGTEAMVKLTAEVADGWLPNGFVPGSLPEYLPWLEDGFCRAGNGKGLANFAIQGSVHVAVNDDVKAALAALNPKSRSMSAAWATATRIFTRISWCAADIARRSTGSRSFIWPAASKTPPPRCPTSGSTTNRWSARPPASSSVTAPGRIAASPA
jgi:F420-dependent oxidoreductase-like protein